MTDTHSPLWYPFDRPLVPATLIERPNRFVAFVELNGHTERVHVPDPGRLPELMIQGRKVMLADYGDNPNRKTRYALILIENPKQTHWVCINTQHPNRLVKHLLQNAALPGYEDHKLIKAEFKLGASRFDFLIQTPQGKECLLEVKAVSLVEDTTQTALFPDAPTVRGTKHCHELIEALQAGLYESAILFVIQRGDALRIQPNEVTDPVFTKALRDADQAGVRISGISCQVDPDGVTVSQQTVPIELKNPLSIA